MPKKKHAHADGNKDLTPFGQDVYEYIRGLKGNNAAVNTLIWSATGIDLSNLTKYFHGKKKPALATVMRIVTAIHPGLETATRMIHAAGYDISDLRIGGNQEYQQMLEEENIEKICELFFAATGDALFDPKHGVYLPVDHLI